MSSSSQSTDLEEWSKAFLEFLKDSNYDKAALKVNNYKNLFALLFVPGCRSKNMSPPPSLDSLINYMKENGSLTEDGEFLRMTCVNDN